MAGPISSRPYEWATVGWTEGRVLTRGTEDGLPVLGWGHADRGELATVRQLRAMGLRPGGAAPVALLAFGHREPGRREVEHARLYAITDAVPKRDATPAQREAIDKALAARRTCTDCGEEQDHYLSTTMRCCTPCADAAGAWDERAYTEDEVRARAGVPAEPARAAWVPDSEWAAVPAQRVAEPPSGTAGSVQRAQAADRGRELGEVTR